MNRDWKSMKDRKAAAEAFLQKTITDPDVRSAVLKDRTAARRIFQREGDVDIPDDVEVICLGPTTQERDRLVVFLLPPDGISPQHIDPLRHWIGAWPPYGGEMIGGPSLRRQGSVERMEQIAHETH
jgi:hypothetical protein